MANLIQEYFQAMILYQSNLFNLIFIQPILAKFLLEQNWEPSSHIKHLNIYYSL